MYCADRRDARGQMALLTLTESRVTGDAYCMARHLTVDGARRRLMAPPCITRIRL
jgi:hypothetical protein